MGGAAARGRARTRRRSRHRRVQGPADQRGQPRARRQLECVAVDGARASVHSASGRLRTELLASCAIWKDLDPVTQEVAAYHTEMAWMNPVRTIWMDGRPHPPAHAPHTWQGFSTGKWEGDMLTVETTHLKPAYVRRNGLARSEKATLREHFIRNGNVLTWISHRHRSGLSDRAVHQEPQLLLRPRLPDGAVSVLGGRRSRRAGRRDPALPARHEPVSPRVRDQVRAAAEAVRGGAETMYPEYIETLKTLKPRRARPPRGRRRDAGGRRRRSQHARLARSPSRCACRQRAVVAQNARRYGRAGAGRYASGCTCSSGPAANTTVQVGRDGVLVVDHADGRRRRAAARGHPHAVRQADPLHRQHAAATPITSAATRRLRRPVRPRRRQHAPAR